MRILVFILFLPIIAFTQPMGSYELLPVEDLNARNGWGFYKDTQYSEGNPYRLRRNSGVQTLPNNAGIKIDSFLPYGLDYLYDENDQLIIGTYGGSFFITVTFKVKLRRMSPPTRVPMLTTGFDIGNGVPVFFKQDLQLIPDEELTQNYLASFTYFISETWAENGGKFTVETNHNVDIWDMAYVIGVNSIPSKDIIEE